jgi:transposase
MNSVGIDLHRKRSFIAVIDDHGDSRCRAESSTTKRRSWSCSAGLDGESQIAVEATYGWEWLAELLEDAGYDMHLAHPLRTTRARMDDWSTSMTATPSANRHPNNRSP